MTRQLQKAETRQKILECAQEEFAENGFLGTRMSDVATAAGVSHGTVFAHYPTQEALITAVIEEYGIRIARRTHELAKSSGKLREILEAHLLGIQEQESFYTRLVLESRNLPPVARQAVISIQSAISFHIGMAATTAMQSGEIIKMPESLLFNTWVGLVNYYLMNSDLFSPETPVLERYGQTLVDHFMKLVTAGNVDR